MSTKVMTSIYLTPTQKRALARRAKQRRTTVSEEIRAALDKHLQEEKDINPAKLVAIAGQANKAVHRMVRKLDETHNVLVNLRRRLRTRRS